MNKHSRCFSGLFIFLATLSFLTPNTIMAKGVDDNLRHQRALEDLKQSRANQQEKQETSAQVRAPDSAGKKSPQNISAAAIGGISELLANLTGREVMVSARVASRKISVAGEGLSESAFKAALLKALKDADVRVTELGKSSLALTDARD